MVSTKRRPGQGDRTADKRYDVSCMHADRSSAARRSIPQENGRGFDSPAEGILMVDEAPVTVKQPGPAEGVLRYPCRTSWPWTTREENC